MTRICRAILQRFHPVRRRRCARGKLATETRAVVAVEFAILAPAFFVVMLGIIDTGLLLTSQALLDTATTDAARLILTGQASANTSAFGSQLCSEVSALIDCSSLTYRVQTGDSFGDIAASYTLDSSGAPVGFAAYPAAISAGNPGGSLTNDFVVVQVAYQRPWLFALLIPAMGSSAELLLSTVVFENEPVP
jgi:Flp pilus assembly protein TadG